MAKKPVARVGAGDTRLLDAGAALDFLDVDLLRESCRGP